MVGVAQQYLDVQVFENVLRNAFDRGHSPNRHKHWGLHLAVRRHQAPGSGMARLMFNLKRNRHRVDSKCKTLRLFSALSAI